MTQQLICSICSCDASSLTKTLDGLECEVLVCDKTDCWGQLNDSLGMHSDVNDFNVFSEEE